MAPERISELKPILRRSAMGFRETQPALDPFHASIEPAQAAVHAGQGFLGIGRAQLYIARIIDDPVELDLGAALPLQHALNQRLQHFRVRIDRNCLHPRPCQRSAPGQHAILRKLVT